LKQNSILTTVAITTLTFSESLSSSLVQQHSLLEVNMIGQVRIAIEATTLLWLGWTFAGIDSLSTVEIISRRPITAHQCPSLRFQNGRLSASRLYSVSDFSSHPYSVYYGTSGSTANQNYGQFDDINDVYGYGPQDEPQDERYDNNDDRHLQSMQRNSLFAGRRGASTFSKKYEQGRLNHQNDMHHERERMFHEERYMEEREMMDDMDSLLHEREHLRRELDAALDENVHLHHHSNVNGGAPQIMPPPQGQNPYCNGMACDGPSANPAVDNVMEQLKNMQHTVRAFEADHRRGDTNGFGNSETSPTGHSEAPSTVQSIKSELEDMEQVLKNLDRVRSSTPANPLNSNGHLNGYEASPGKASQSTYTNGVDSGVSPWEQRQNQESINGSIPSDHSSHLFNERYEVVIKAELKKKNGFDGTHETVEKQIDVNNGFNNARGNPTVETFGSRYL